MSEYAGTDYLRQVFTSKERDVETGLDHFGRRYYDSELGHFTSVDSANLELTNPQSLNRYPYVLNNPLSYIDPDGEKPVDFLLGRATFRVWAPTGAVIDWQDIFFATAKVTEDTKQRDLEQYPRANTNRGSGYVRYAPYTSQYDLFHYVPSMVSENSGCGMGCIEQYQATYISVNISVNFDDELYPGHQLVTVEVSRAPDVGPARSNLAPELTAIPSLYPGTGQPASQATSVTIDPANLTQLTDNQLKGLYAATLAKRKDPIYDAIYRAAYAEIGNRIRAQQEKEKKNEEEQEDQEDEAPDSN